MADPHAEVRMAPKGECRSCDGFRERGESFFPSHQGSPRCQSSSIASGGHRSHCTCDTCW